MAKTPTSVTENQKELDAALDEAEVKYHRERHQQRKPYVGAIVRFVDPYGNPEIYAAIVTRVAANGYVNLAVFAPGVAPYDLRQVAVFDIEGKVRGSWHWGEEN